MSRKFVNVVNLFNLESLFQIRDIAEYSQTNFRLVLIFGVNSNFIIFGDLLGISSKHSNYIMSRKLNIIILENMLEKETFT